MTKFRNIVLTLGVLALSISTPLNILKAQSVFNAPLPDSGDALQVYSPVADSYVKGTINISMNIVDDDVDGVEYTVGLYDSANCSSLVGNIAANTGEGNISISWNTRTTQSTSNLQDGKYCLKVCAVMQNNSSGLYSACNGRRINVLNNNTKPIITSTLGKTVYLNGESFSYQLSATDAESDPLKYRLVSTPGFLTIKQSTGLITSTSPLNTNGAYGLQYSVTVGVNDNKSGETFQTFSFEVYAQDPNTPTTTPPTNNNGGTNNPTTTPDSTTDEDTDQEVEEPEVVNISDFEFLDIEEDTVITEPTIQISWSYGDSADSVKSASLQFSGDGSNWNELTNEMSPDQTTYDWDVSSLESGEYYVRLVITKSDETDQIEESESFVINLQQDGENTSEALIISVSPEPDSEISDTKPKISGQLLPSNDSEVLVETFKILLDGRDISDSCDVSDDNRFECDLGDNLDTGRHVISASFSDDTEKTAEREWTFSVIESTPDSGTVSEESSGGLSQSAILFILLLLGLGLIVLIVPWILYTLWARNNHSDSKTTTESTYNVTTNVPAAPAPVDPYAEFDYQYPDININTEYAQPETPVATSTDNYIQPYDVNVNTEVTPAPQPELVQPDLVSQQPQVNVQVQPTVQEQYPNTDYIKPYDQGNSQADSGDFVEPEKTS